MNGQFFVLAIIVLVIGVPVSLGILGDIAKRWISLKERQLDRAAQLAAEKGAAQAMHIDKLERRVRVLERIATDRGVDLAHQIDSLGDGRLN